MTVIQTKTSYIIPSLHIRTTKSLSGSGGIRTHASEETGALNQRLRPLGHATPTEGRAAARSLKLTSFHIPPRPYSFPYSQLHMLP